MKLQVVKEGHQPPLKNPNTLCTRESVSFPIAIERKTCVSFLVSGEEGTALQVLQTGLLDQQVPNSQEDQAVSCEDQ